MPIVIAETQVLSELQPWENLCLNIRATEPRDLSQPVFRTIDIVDGVGSQPVGLIALFTCRWREDECRTDDARILRVSTLEVSFGMREVG